MNALQNPPPAGLIVRGTSWLQRASQSAVKPTTWGRTATVVGTAGLVSAPFMISAARKHKRVAETEIGKTLQEWAWPIAIVGGVFLLSRLN